LDRSKTFGEKGNFAVIYRPCPDEYDYDPTNKMAICHLVIGNTVLGELDEECYLPTWFFNITCVRDLFKECRNQLYPSEFDNVSDREIFELIMKSNQLDNEFDINYSYLPQLDNNVWKKHFLTLDETIDGFCICYYIKDNKIRFIIEKVWPEAVKDKSQNFFFESVDFDFFISTLDEAIDFLEATYPYLTKSKNRYYYGGAP
jgi:hypothetical protein